jgi:predicted glycoside hydrolase/deacetylase ChbG (UPF0249 family)
MKREIVPVLLVLCVASWSVAAEEAGRPIELCVRADDMGHALDVNLAIIKAHTEGIVTSASLMPPTAYFDDAVARCRAHPNLAAGIHLTLMAVVPMRPVLPPDQVPSLVAPDGFLYRGGADFSKARPKIDEVEKELRAQIRKCLATGLRFWYIDSHMSSGGGKDQPDIAALYPRLAAEYRLLFTQDPDGRYSGAKFVPASLESWKCKRRSKNVARDGACVTVEKRGALEPTRGRVSKACDGTTVTSLTPPRGNRECTRTWNCGAKYVAGF